MDELRRSLGDGKEHYERLLAEKNRRIKQLEEEIEGLNRSMGSGKDVYERQIQMKDTKLADLTTTLKGNHSDAVSAKNAHDRAAAELRSQIEAAKAENKKEHDNQREAIAQRERKAKQMEEEVTKLSDVVVKEKDRELDALKEELKDVRANEAASRKKTADEIAKVRQISGREAMEADLAQQTQDLRFARLDLDDLKRENVILKEQWAKKSAEIEAKVTLEHKLRFQTEINAVTEKNARKIKDLTEEVGKLRAQIETQKKWQTSSGLRSKPSGT